MRLSWLPCFIVLLGACTAHVVLCRIVYGVRASFIVGSMTWVDLDPSLLPQCWSSSTVLVACSKLRVALSEQMLTEVVAWFRDSMHVGIIIQAIIME